MKKLIAYWHQVKHLLLKTQATRDTVIIYVSQVFASGVGFISSVIVARTLAPADFGIITAYNSIIITAVGLTEFGLGTGLIRFATPLLKRKSNAALAYLRFVFYAEIGAGLLVLVIGLLFSGFVQNFVGDSLSLWIIRLAITSAAITSTAAYVNAVLNTYKKFKLSALVVIIVNILRLGFIVALLFTGNLSVPVLLVGYFVLSILSAIIGFSVIPKDYLKPVAREKVKAAGKKIFAFSGWLTLAFIFNSVSSRLDFFYLYRIRGPEEAGVYAAAIQLSLLFSILIGAISTVMTPYISEKTTYPQQKKFLKKSLKIASGIAFMLLLSIFIFPFIITLVFGPEYSGAIPPLQILIVHFALNVILIPISLMFIPLGKVNYGAALTALQLVIALILYPKLIGLFGAEGAALTVLANTIIALIIYPVMLLYLFKKQRKRESLAV